MKVMLLFPPNWTPSMPHLSMPTLAAYLRPQGIQVIQRDLNLEVFDEILTRPYMEKTLAHLRQDYGPQANKRPAKPALPARQKVLWALQEGPSLVARVDDSGSSAEVELAPGADHARLLKALVDAGVGLVRFEVIEPSLHSIFISKVGVEAATAIASEAKHA